MKTDNFNGDNKKILRCLSQKSHSLYTDKTEQIKFLNFLT